VLLLLIGRLLDEPAARECESYAVSEARGRVERLISPTSTRAHSRGGSASALGGYAYGAFMTCFVRKLTPPLLQHPHGDPELRWLRFYFPREGWHRSFETPGDDHALPEIAGIHHALHPAPSRLAKSRTPSRRNTKTLRQHHALTSLQPGSDLLGHGWKQMGTRLVAPGPECMPLQTSHSNGSVVLSPAGEANLTIEMCWWRHPIYGRRAYAACHSPDGNGRVALTYHVVGSDSNGHPATTAHTLNLTERSAKRVSRSQHLGIDIGIGRF